MELIDFNCITEAFPDRPEELVERVIAMHSFCTSFPKNEVESFFIKQINSSPVFATSFLKRIQNAKMELSSNRDSLLSVLPNSYFIDYDGPGCRTHRRYFGYFGPYAALLHSIKNGSVSDGTLLEYPDPNGSGEVLRSDNIKMVENIIDNLLSQIPSNQYIEESTTYYTKDCANQDLDTIFDSLDMMQNILARNIHNAIAPYPDNEDMKKLCDVLLKYIPDVLENVEDSSSLFQVLMLNGGQAPKIKSGKKHLFVHILLLLYLDGPMYCRNINWYNRAIAYFGLEETEKKRKYEKPNDKINDFIFVIKSVLNSTANYEEYCEKKKIV